mmetsp:Transcript_19328/g.42686  ORF Transcript_19328/g.42686 Transcript_19328/m.42686 type:complete len:91 (+) Transcript_19328:131-403(+)
MTFAPLGHPHFLEALSLPVHHQASDAIHNTSQLMVLHPFDEMIVSISASQRMPYILKLFEGSLLVPVLVRFLQQAHHGSFSLKGTRLPGA